MFIILHRFAVQDLSYKTSYFETTHPTEHEVKTFPWLSNAKGMGRGQKAEAGGPLPFVLVPCP